MNINIEKAIQNKFLNRISGVEFIVSEKCQNNCKYCYRVKKHLSSPVSYIKPSLVKLFVENLTEMFHLTPDFFHNRKAELFGGEAMLNYKYLHDILDYLLNDVKFKEAIIPTNARMAQELTSYDLDHILDIAPGRIHLSLSVDGQPQDNQRPLSKYGRMLAYQEQINYDKLIALAKKRNCGFHPMLSFDSPETWFETFKFFLDRGVIPYLLEIRHSIPKEDTAECVKQLVYIRKYVDKYLKPELRKLVNTVNMSIVPRGLGCSAHTTLSIMPNGDVPFCHRVVDPPWVMANVLTKEFNISRAITLTAGHDHRNHPLCIACQIKTFCAGQCAGASYEYWGDPWIPIESICQFLKLKAYIMSLYFEDWSNIKNHLTYGTVNDLRKDIISIFGEKLVKELENL